MDPFGVVWGIFGQAGYIGAPTDIGGGVLAFDFPTRASANWVDSMLQQHIKPLALLSSQTLSISLEVVTTGTPVFKYDSEPTNTCIFPAHARPYFDGPAGRWWSNPVAYELAAGSTTLSVDLTPDKWSNAQGQFGDHDAATLQNFADVLAATTDIGLVFGGGCFFGHGVNVSGGTAQLQLSNLSVN